ncbi:hypothetical protein V1511DRAFT_272792 [Dipodascopsis uninucleata]
MLGWIFDDTLDEATLRQQLEEDGFDVTSNSIPDTPAASTWALHALPTIFTGTPRLTNKLQDHSLLDEEVADHIRVRNSDNRTIERDEGRSHLYDVNTNQRRSQEVQRQSKQSERRTSVNEPLRNFVLRRNLAGTSALSSTQHDKENRNPDGNQTEKSILERKVIDFPMLDPMPNPDTPIINTPTRKFRAPKAPISIMRTPGASTAKKVVKFASGEPEDVSQLKFSSKEQSAKTVRSGLPRNFPGKFPSPWTPKSIMIESLDLAETPTTFAKRKGLTVLSPVKDLSIPKAETDEAASKMKLSSTRAIPENSTKAFSATPVDTSTASMEDESSKSKLISLVYDQMYENNSNLERLIKLRRAKGNTRENKRATKLESDLAQMDLNKDYQEPVEMERYWKRKFEETEEERQKLILLLDEVQQHAENVTQFAKSQDKKVTELKRKLALESQKTRETEQMVRELSKQMEFLKEKTADVNRRRIRKNV